MKTAFMASDPIALESIKYLRSCHDFPLACVVSNPDKPKGRGKCVQPNPVSAWAISEGVELMRPEGSPGVEVSNALRAMGVDLIVVMAYGSMLGDNILNYGKYPCLNLHASILPELRGASPIESAIALGMRRTGVSLMKIVKKMDAGPVCAVKEVDIGERETSTTLREKISRLSAELLREKLCDLLSSGLEFTPQDESRATYVRKLSKLDMRLDFNLSAREIDARIRAFGAGIFEYNGETVKVGESFFSDNSPRGAVPGTVLEASGKNGLAVACASGTAFFTKLQRPCAKMLPASEFFSARKFDIGYVIQSAELEPLLKRK